VELLFGARLTTMEELTVSPPVGGTCNGGRGVAGAHAPRNRCAIRPLPVGEVACQRSRVSSPASQGRSQRQTSDSPVLVLRISE